MPLSRLAREFAAEIAGHDWSDAPYRTDRAGHQRQSDTNAGPKQLSDQETTRVRTNVMWVAAQVLSHADPNFDVHEFAKACGVPTSTPTGSRGWIEAGIRKIYDPDSPQHETPFPPGKP